MRILGASCIILAIGVSGCSSYRDPSITVGSSRLVDAADEALAIKVTIELSNPNNEPLELLAFDYHMNVDGVRVHHGRRAAGATLAPNSTRTVEIPAVIPYRAVHWNAQSLPAETHFTISGELRYVTPGEIAQILLDSGVRRPSVSFHGNGQVDLSLARQSVQ